MQIASMSLVSTIRSVSEGAVQRHVESELNHADDALKGRKTARWLESPTFFKKGGRKLAKKTFLNLNNKTDLKIKWTVNSTKAETFVVV